MDLKSRSLQRFPRSEIRVIPSVTNGASFMDRKAKTLKPKFGFIVTMTEGYPCDLALV